jgi:cell division protein FtsB
LAPYEKVFSICPDESAAANRTFLARLKNRGSVLSRVTGVRLSRRVALFLLIVLCGWFVSLAFIIHLQSRRITEQEQELLSLRQENHHSLMELARLKERIRPLEQLGVLRDGPPGPAAPRPAARDTLRKTGSDTIPSVASDTLKDSVLP